MLLAIDIGNSSIKFGIFDGNRLFHRFSIQTKRDYSADELMFDRLKLYEKQFIQVDIDRCVVVSVVPELDPVITKVTKKLFKVSPKFVDHTWDLGFAIRYDPPSSIGADRLVNAYAASKKTGTPVIVCSFGTATTIDVVDANNVFLGGVIAPGVKVSSQALNLAAAQLPEATIKKPESVIGSSTESSIRSGVVFGQIAMAEGIIERMKKELGNSGIKVIATGGFAPLIATEVAAINEIDETLTIEGLRMLSDAQNS